MTDDDPELVVAATEMRYPAAVVWIDANGDMTAANVKVPWNGELPATARAPIPRDKLARGILEVVARDRGTVAADIAADRLHRLAAPRSMLVDDPPPPPDELDVPARDSNEGKLGVPDRDRTEGQYRMKRDEPPDPDEEAAYAARDASWRVFRARPTAGGGLPHDLIGVQSQLAPLIVASSTAPASRVAAVLLATRAVAIAAAAVAGSAQAAAGARLIAVGAGDNIDAERARMLAALAAVERSSPPGPELDVA